MQDKTREYCRIALSFFRDNKISITEMNCMHELMGNPKNENTRFCQAKLRQIYPKIDRVSLKKN